MFLTFGSLLFLLWTSTVSAFVVVDVVVLSSSLSTTPFRRSAPQTTTTTGFKPTIQTTLTTTCLFSSMDTNNDNSGGVAIGEDAATQERIQQLINDHPIVLFMKGSQLFPQCGFSNTAVQILNALLGVGPTSTYKTVDVLADESIRQGIKIFSQWPTIPQLYVGGEFIGGSDIMIQMYQSGELGELLEKAQADQM
ncbi:hypothetical protein ACA910_013801 [Epithemia clementina (nom. ined.)]